MCWLEVDVTGKKYYVPLQCIDCKHDSKNSCESPCKYCKDLYGRIDQSKWVTAIPETLDEILGLRKD